MTTKNLHWTHNGLDAFAIVDSYTITDAILRDRNTQNRYNIYQQLDGDEVLVHTTNDLDDAVNYINTSSSENAQ